MKQTIIFFILTVFIFLQGCESFKGVTKDVANTANNIRSVINLGKDINDIAN